MERPPVIRHVSRLYLAVIAGLGVSLCAASAGAQTAAPDLAGLSLQDLMAIEVVATASKFPQSVREAPASITIVTAADIRTYGYRTLSEALRSVRGFYTSYDRNYEYLGVRGFSRPGDYNTRVLLLVDGHRVNDVIYDMAAVGTDFVVDMSLIDRIEVIRGPGSSLYGTNALFGVVNVITRTGAGRPGVQVEARGGTLDTGLASASYGRLFGDGREVLVSGSTYRSGGQQRLRYPEFADVVPDGEVADLDHDAAHRMFASLSAGRFSLRAAVVSRTKHVPTAAFGAVFGDDRFVTTDSRAFLNGVYDGPIGRGWMATARMAYDYYAYAGDYPFDYGDAGVQVFADASHAHSLTGELTARRRVGTRHYLATGVEVHWQVDNHQSAGDVFGETLNINVPGTTVGVYAQDEFRPAPWLLVNAGVRLDRFSSYGSHVTPRAGLVLLPRPQTAFKLLYGAAFRAPNAYERFYFTAQREAGDTLEPEQIKSAEIVWEETLSKNWRASVSAFQYRVEGLIEQRESPPVDGDLLFVNAGAGDATGLEAEVEARFDNGLAARFSHTYARVVDRDTGAAVSNSPRHLSKAGVQVPLAAVVVGVEGQFVGERLTIGGERLAPFFVPNVTLGSRAAGRVQVSASIYNLFGRAYADPGAAEHAQPAIRQDGRTALVRIAVRF
jgi:outer membrane receptor for ferrienterochelin and colicins